jgi:predicted dienelactone hydrolase
MRNSRRPAIVFASMKLFWRLLILAVLPLSPATGAVTPQTAAASAPHGVSSAEFTWHDTRRDRDVPVKIYSPTGDRGPFPVIVFSHGLGGTREDYKYLGQYWARHGYVCVHLQHLGSDDAVWRAAGFLDGMAAMRKSVADPRNAINRALDVSFAIDELERLNRDQSPYQEQLDLDHLGVAGHSFGAHTALAVAGQVFSPGLNASRSLADARVKAVIPMSAPVPANKRRLDETYAKIHIPCLHMTGTRDASPIGDTQPEERRLPFDHCRNSDQYLLVFQDGDHMTFSGRRSHPSKQQHTFQELICKSSTAFWDAYLRGDSRAKAWLANDFKTVLGSNGTFEVKLPK